MDESVEKESAGNAMSAEETDTEERLDIHSEKGAEDIQSDSEAKIKVDQAASEKDNVELTMEGEVKVKMNEEPSEREELQEHVEEKPSTSTSRVSSAGSRGKEVENRPKSGGSESVSNRGKRRISSAAPGSHRVTFTVTIAKAIPTAAPTLSDADEVETEESEASPTKKRGKRVIECPRPQNYFHHEYYLLPDDTEPVKTDVVTYGIAAKVFTYGQPERTVATWQDGDQTWIAWTHNHTKTVSEDMLVKLFKHDLGLRVWDTKDKCGQKARFDRIKSLKLPPSKPGEGKGAGVRNLVLKLSKNYEKLQPKRPYIDRPLPSQSRPRVIIEDPSSDTNKEKDVKGTRFAGIPKPSGKPGSAQAPVGPQDGPDTDPEKTTTSGGQPTSHKSGEEQEARLSKTPGVELPPASRETKKTGVSSGGPSGKSAPTTSPTRASQSRVGPSDNKDKNSSPARASQSRNDSSGKDKKSSGGRESAKQSPTNSPPKSPAKWPGKENLKLPQLEANAPQQAQASRLQQAKVKFPSLELGSSLTTLPGAGDLEPDENALRNSEALDLDGTLASRKSPASATKSPSRAEVSRPRRNRKAEEAAKAAAEHAKKFGVCNVPISIKKFFASFISVTERLDKPVNGIEDLFFSVALSGPLMTEEQKKNLNPLVVSVHSATQMPSTPISYADLRLRCQPAYIRYNLFGESEHQSVGREQDENIYWDDVNVCLVGTLEPWELREHLNGPPLAIQVHDRDRLGEEQKLKPTLFGDDLEDEKISNVGTVTSKRTTHNPFKGRDQPWDPYGQAKFDLSCLLQGQQVAYMKAPVLMCPIPDVLGLRESREGKLIGISGAVDGPVDSPIATGHYLQSGAMLKIKVELAHPLVKPNQLAAKKDLETTHMCPFARMVFRFAYKNAEFLQKLQMLITEINSRALDLMDMPSHVIDAALSTYKLSQQQQISRELDIVTGFQVLDRTMHLFVLEGLRDKAMKHIWELLPKPENKPLPPDLNVETLYNSDLAFSERLYGPLDVDLCRIKLHEPLSVIVQQPLLYVRDMVPKPCFEALVKLEELTKTDKLRDAVRNDLLPTAEMVVSMSREFGVPMTAEDFEAIRVQTPREEESQYQCIRAHPSRDWTPIDHYNEEYIEQIKNRTNSEPTSNYQKENQVAVHDRSEFNRMERSKTMPVKVRVEGVGHNYSTQTLNSTEKAREKLRQKLAKNPDRRYTYCPEYHHSMTVVPVNVEAVKKQEEVDSKSAWKTPKGWVFPGKKTMIESNKHPGKLHHSRVEELNLDWEENSLHAKYKPTLGREGYTWDNRREDMDLWTRPHPVFGQNEPITIHQAGEKLKQEKLAAQKQDKDIWKSKILVDDVRTYFYRCAPDTELTEKGISSSNQLARLQGLLKDPPEKYTLQRPGMALREIPPLNVVLNPSVDTRARESGMPLRPAELGERDRMKGFAPGPYREYSWSLEKNQIPVRDYEHKRFSDEKGHDFNVYHKERSNLYKRKITPLANEELDTHLFRWPAEYGGFGMVRGMTSYELPNVEEFKRHATQDTLDSGFVSIGVHSAQPRLKIADMA